MVIFRLTNKLFGGRLSSQVAATLFVMIFMTSSLLAATVCFDAGSCVRSPG